MSRAAKFRDNVKEAWASQPEFQCRCSKLKAVAQTEMGVIIPQHSQNLNACEDRCLAEFGQWLVDTFGSVPDAK